MRCRIRMPGALVTSALTPSPAGCYTSASESDSYSRCRLASPPELLLRLACAWHGGARGVHCHRRGANRAWRSSRPHSAGHGLGQNRNRFRRHRRHLDLRPHYAHRRQTRRPLRPALYDVRRRADCSRRLLCAIRRSLRLAVLHRLHHSALIRGAEPPECCAAHRGGELLSAQTQPRAGHYRAEPHRRRGGQHSDNHADCGHAELARRIHNLGMPRAAARRAAGAGDA